MEISGSYTLYAPRERVWKYMLDPTVLARTVPGCEELEQEAPDRLRGRLKVGIASVKGTYDGTLRVLEQVEPEFCRIQVDGKGTTGNVHGQGLVRLEARGPTTTIITYEGQTQLGGPLASVGARMLNAAARMLTNQFFSHLADVIAEVEPAPGEGPRAWVDPASAVAASPTTRTSSGVADTAWTTGLPEARPLEAEQMPAEAAPLPSEERPAATSIVPMTAAGPRTRPVPLQWAPAPRLLTRLVRQSGLSDGSSESEQRIARQMLLAGVGVLAAGALALTIVLAGGRRRGP